MNPTTLDTGTLGFVQSMAERYNFGCYAILGNYNMRKKKSEIMNAYVSAFPENTSTVGFSHTHPSDEIPLACVYNYDRNFSSVNLDLRALVHSRPNVVLFDSWEITNRQVEDLALISAMSNTVFTQCFDFASDFIQYLKAEFDAPRIILDRLKGITLTQSVLLDNGEYINVQESVRLNDEIRRNLMLCAHWEIDEYLHEQMMIQGMATATQQIAARNRRIAFEGNLHHSNYAYC